MIDLEIPKKFNGLVNQAHQVALEVFRSNSRKYDRAEHTYPRELDMLAAVIDGMNEGGALAGAGAGMNCRNRHVHGRTPAALRGTPLPVRLLGIEEVAPVELADIQQCFPSQEHDCADDVGRGLG